MKLLNIYDVYEYFLSAKMGAINSSFKLLNI
jgi:hypothetical protein